MSSPTQRSLALLRERGYIADVVERWIPFARVRRDLFGIIDIVAIGNGETLGVQACCYSDVSKRVIKINAAPASPVLRESGWRVVVLGWRKVKGRWTAREVEITAKEKIK